MPLHRYWFITRFPLRSCSSCWFNSSMFMPNAILVWHSNIFICFLTSRSPLCELSSPAREEGPWVWKINLSDASNLFLLHTMRRAVSMEAWTFIIFNAFLCSKKFPIYTFHSLLLSMNGRAVNKRRKKLPSAGFRSLKTAQDVEIDGAARERNVHR